MKSVAVSVTFIEFIRNVIIWIIMFNHFKVIISNAFKFY